ncbi:hypothetical protein [Kitasatospora sp. NPDC004289]
MARFRTDRPRLSWCTAALVATLALLHTVLSSTQPHLPMGHPDHCRTVVTAAAAPAGQEDAATAATETVGRDRPAPGQCAVDTHQGRHSSPQVRASVSVVALGVTPGADRPPTRPRTPSAPRPASNSSTVLRC